MMSVSLQSLLLILSSTLPLSFHVLAGNAYELPENQNHEGSLVQNNKISPKSNFTTRDKNLFYAWNLNKDSLMNGLFPDLTQLQAAWEVHPLLSKVSFAPPQIGAPLGSIPTIFHNRTSLLNLNEHSGPDSNDPLLSLFMVDNSLDVLSHINMYDSSEYILVKKIVKDGKEIMSSVPRDEHGTNQITKKFHDEGFSLVINYMQRRWNSIAKLARRMEEELGAVEVNANLYLTPEVLLEKKGTPENGVARKAGFIAHWDAIDIIVVQIAGRKRWSVSRDPIVYLSNVDKVRIPSQEEVEHYARDNQFLEFTMCPGDAMYIPRGHMHNASTIVFDQLDRKWLDWDECPADPAELAGTGPLASALAMPSMHLTFGLVGDYTMEALVHFALQAFYEDESSDRRRSVAIPAKICSSPGQKTMDVDWRAILHNSLAEVTRRDNDCDNPSYRGLTSKQPRRCNAILRKSVPLLLESNNVASDLKRLDVARQVNIRILKTSYQKAVEVFGLSASLSKTGEFIESDLLPPSAAQESMYYPWYLKERAILCPHELNVLSKDNFSHILQDFVQFAKSNFNKAFNSMSLDGRLKRDVDRQKQRFNLEKVGQGGGL